MEYRSTNPSQHLLHNAVAGVESSHGVEIGTHPTSTGACVQAVGDDAAIQLAVFGKGTGPTVLGSATSPVTIAGPALTIGANSSVVSIGTASTIATFGSTNVIIGATGGTVQFAGSTAPFAGFVRITSTMRTPNLSGSTDAGSGVSTVTLPAGTNSSHFLVVNTANLSTAWAMGEAWVSSAAEGKVKFIKASTVASGASSLAVNILVYRF